MIKFTLKNSDQQVQAAILDFHLGLPAYKKTLKIAHTIFLLCALAMLGLTALSLIALKRVDLSTLVIMAFTVVAYFVAAPLQKAVLKKRVVAAAVPGEIKYSADKSGISVDCEKGQKHHDWPQQVDFGEKAGYYYIYFQSDRAYLILCDKKQVSAADFKQLQAWHQESLASKQES